MVLQIIKSQIKLIVLIAYEEFCGDSLDVVLQIIKSQIKLIVLIARVDIFFFNSQNFFIN